jgi:hypothetical protein
MEVCTRTISSLDSMDSMESLADQGAGNFGLLVAWPAATLAESAYIVETTLINAQIKMMGRDKNVQRGRSCGRVGKSRGF